MTEKELDRILEHWLGWALGRQEVQRVLVCTLGDGTSEIYSGWTRPNPDLSLQMQFRIRRGSDWMRVEQRFTDGTVGATRWRSAAFFGDRRERKQSSAGAFPRHASSVRLVHWRDAMARA